MGFRYTGLYFDYSKKGKTSTTCEFVHNKTVLLHRFSPCSSSRSVSTKLNVLATADKMVGKIELVDYSQFKCYLRHKSASLLRFDFVIFRALGLTFTRTLGLAFVSSPCFEPSKYSISKEAILSSRRLARFSQSLSLCVEVWRDMLFSRRLVLRRLRLRRPGSQTRIGLPACLDLVNRLQDRSLDRVLRHCTTLRMLKVSALLR